MSRKNLADQILLHTKFIYYLLNLYNVPHTEQEECYQAFVTQLLHRGHNYDVNQKFTTYAGRAFANFMHDLRKRPKNKFTKWNVVPDTELVEKQTFSTPIDDILSIDKILKTLPEFEQSILIKVYFEDYQVRQLAKDLKCSESYVHRTINEALEFLRRQLEGICNSI